MRSPLGQIRFNRTVQAPVACARLIAMGNLAKPAGTDTLFGGDAT